MSLPIAILRKAVITDASTINQGFVTVEIDTTSKTLPVETQKKKKIQIPFSFYSIEGMFIGGAPKVGTPVVIGRGESTNWYFVSFSLSNLAQLPNLSEGQILAQTNNNTMLSLTTSNTIDIGSKNVNLHFNTSTNKFINKSQNNFSSNFSFSEASREINGIVKREVRLDNVPTSNQLKLISESYDNNLTPIGLDPTSTTVINTKDSSKNPPFVEKREILYEFAYSSGILDDITESAIYSSDQQATQKISNFSYPNRRESKTDTLSLSLVSPNYLMETVKGTVVDIFGNILDLNRTPIVGYNLNTPDLMFNAQSPKDQIFEAIRNAERKSIAYHFEINARKDLSAGNGKFKLPDINSAADYARSRSRFFLDIDKEGQFKLNVPASSETGNIPYHVRYENYSTFNTDDNNNPNKLIFNNDSLDIYLDSFAEGDVDIRNNNRVISPIDRITQSHIKHGMPYHSILNSAISFQSNSNFNFSESFLNYQTVFTPVDINKIPSIDSGIISSTITTSGDNANAGGRSGSLNFDGSIECSIGANTIDRQSLWLDTAGGVIANIGRDRNFVSAAVSLDGDLLVQIGGYGVTGDSRFSSINNSYRGGALDIRVLNDGFTATILRIDKNGITIMTPNTITYSARKIVMNAVQMELNADELSLNRRQVAKFPATSI